MGVRSGRSVAAAVLAVVAAVGLLGCGSSSTDTGGTTRPTTGATPARAIRPDGSLPADRADRVGQVVRVVDGDTIIVRLGGQDRRLRYIGMDTPETKKPDTPVQWMGPEASAANAALVEGRMVVLEKDVSETDRFGRLLRYVWLLDEIAGRWSISNSWGGDLPRSRPIRRT